MAKVKVSATIDPERLASAQRIVGSTNVSEVLELALAALLERELERRWLAAHPVAGRAIEANYDLSDLPWEDE